MDDEIITYLLVGQKRSVYKVEPAFELPRRSEPTQIGVANDRNRIYVVIGRIEIGLVPGSRPVCYVRRWTFHIQKLTRLLGMIHRNEIASEPL